MINNEVDQTKNEWDEFFSDLREEYEKTKKELVDVSVTLEQCQSEVNKLAQRNAAVGTHLQQLLGQFESVSRSDIQSAYEAALDAQQRLFIMRGKLERLQEAQKHLKYKAELVERTIRHLENQSQYFERSSRPDTKIETLEAMIRAQEDERQRLSRQMHDGPAQALSNFILQTEIALRLFDVDQSRAKEELTNLMATATASFQKVRDFIFDLRPMMLDDLGLIPTLKRYVEAVKEKTGGEIRLTTTGFERRIEPYLEVMIFRAIQELVGNAIRHSQATRINVQCDITDNSVKVIVEDNGQGFDLKKLEEGGKGIKIIRDRVEVLGGEFDISSVIGQGTRVSFRIPAGQMTAIE